jgi:FkbM family methyltransferase
MQNPQVVKKACRHGVLSFFVDDEYVGKSLDLYGDYSEDEVSVFQKVLKPDHIAIEVGSNIGALTVPMAKLCKRVYAFEPQPQNCNLLCLNLNDNGLGNDVVVNRDALGSKLGRTHVETFDELKHTNYGQIEVGNGSWPVRVRTLDRCLPPDEVIQFIKIDAEGSELEVLKGAVETIARCRPILYVENDRKEKSSELVGWLIDHNYRCYWHRVPLYYEGNYRHSILNVFGNTVSINMICVPEEAGIVVELLDEVEDRRCDDQMYVREQARAMKRLEKTPDDFEARVLVAHYANLMDDEVTARKYLKENLVRDPSHAPSLAVIGLMELQKGNYKDGWQAYELRYAQRDPKTFGWRPHDVPHWDGQPTDEIVLIWTEQGWGDSIMFSRFILDVLRRAPNAILEVQPQLFELFELSNLVPREQLFRLGRSLPEYTMHSSLPSIPATLKFDSEKQLSNIWQSSLRHKQYLFADEKMIEGWRKRNTPRIGICQRGGTASERAYSRDMPEEVAAKLARKFGPFMALTHDGQWESYADTAAAIEALDLVLTVDTSVAHLAGALGVSTILMLSSDPDWRWGKYRHDSPWYPSMTIFRQEKFMDWSNVIEDVSRELSLRKQMIEDRKAK